MRRASSREATCADRERSSCRLPGLDGRANEPSGRPAEALLTSPAREVEQWPPRPAPRIAFRK